MASSLRTATATGTTESSKATQSSLDSLKNLIAHLHSIQSKDIVPPAFRFIPNLRQCVLVLEEIDAVVGLEPFKGIVLSKFKSFVVNYLRTGSPLGKSSLHTLIHAKPGMGKTHIGRLLAKFWAATGCLNRQPPSFMPRNPLPVRPNQLKQREQISSAMSMINQIRKRVKSRKEETNPQLQAKFQELKTKLRQVYNDLDYKREVLPIMVPSIQPRTEELKFGLFTRADFIGQFQGHSVERTRDIFRRYKGGVIMIDEAYSLATSENDSFGREVLTEINNHMSLYPDDIVFIFAGYPQQMKELLKLQPGLARRFNWTIEINDYDSQELLEILEQQLGNQQLNLSPAAKDYYLHILEKEKAYFPHYGGDTYTLSNQLIDCLNDQLWVGVVEGSVMEVDPVYEISLTVAQTAFARYKQFNPRVNHDPRDDYPGLYT